MCDNYPAYLDTRGNYINNYTNMHARLCETVYYIMIDPPTPNPHTPNMQGNYMHKQRPLTSQNARLSAEVGGYVGASGCAALLNNFHPEQQGCGT